VVIYHVQGLSTDREDCRAHPTQNIITHRLTLKHTKKQVEAVHCCRNYCVCRCGTEHKTQPISYSTQHTAHSTQQHNVAICCAVLRCVRAVICGGLQSSYIPPQHMDNYTAARSTQHTAHTTHRTQDTIHNKQHTDTATRTHRWHMYPLRHRRRNKHTHTHTQTQSLREYSSKQQHIIQ
jgi:hypothetical protein